MFFLDRRSWKINEVFKVFQIPLDLKLAARTQIRKENLLQIVFKTCLCALFVVENNFQLNFAPLFTFMPSDNVYMDKKKPRHSRNNFGRLAWLSSFNNKITQKKEFLQQQKLCNSTCKDSNQNDTTSYSAQFKVQPFLSEILKR